MGVPAFFRWLCNVCPQMLIDKNNPPDIDNLYLDMNGIIHPCTHPPPTMNLTKPSNFEQMKDNIIKFLDDLITICKPKKLVYMAIDGVAPRAKMNQQRSRRFRSGIEINKEKLLRAKLKQKFEKNGIKIKDKIWKKETFDHNVITPGTEFMYKVHNLIIEFIKDKLLNDDKWKHLNIIFNDSSNPGEGEHKILEYIRSQRLKQNYNPNMSHCIFGADADLIFLSLSTHEPKFYILRETFNNSLSKLNRFKENPFQKILTLNFNIEMQFVDIFIIRLWLEYYTRNLHLKMRYDLERIIDDFVFICFFVGNDFLPHMPGFNIVQGGIDILFYIYKKKIINMNDYLTKSGEVIIKNLNLFLENFDLFEKEILNYLERRNDEYQEKLSVIDSLNKKKYSSMFKENECIEINNLKKREKQIYIDEEKDNKEANDLEKIKENEELIEERFNNELNLLLEEDFNLKKSKVEDLNQIYVEVKNYKEKYYKEKFKIDGKNFEYLKKILNKYYLQGIVWNNAYYYNGCISWDWYFPFYYSPYISDLKDLDLEEFKFDIGVPFKPLYQLMAVLSPFSFSAVPEGYQGLMLKNDSKICDFYPTNFFVDLKGKSQKLSWLGEVILPFIDGKRLVDALEEKKDLLTDDENKRNSKNPVLIFNNNNKFKFKNVFGEFKPVNNENDTINIAEYIQPDGKVPICHLLEGVDLPEIKIRIQGNQTKNIQNMFNIINKYI